MTADTLLDRFRNPASTDRGRVSWIWNGKLDRSHLLRQLRQFHAEGLSGALIRAGDSLRIPYLGPEWLEAVNACADEAARLGLKFWLADEERGPSGAAGGLATREFVHARKFLRLEVAAPGFTWPKRSSLVGAWVARVDGLSFTESEPLEAGAAPPSDGRSVLLFTTGTCASQTIHNDNPPLDLLSPEATAHFIDITHERYRSRALTRLGAVLDGFFTDTPSPGTLMSGSGGAEWTVPWTPGLWDEFHAAWGYDLRAHLPELFLFPDGRRFSRVKLNFACSIQRMLENNWLRPLREWCDGARMTLVGRLPGGSSIAAQSAACPSVIRSAEFFDILATDGGTEATLKLVASAARQLGGKPVLDLTPPDATASSSAAAAMDGISACNPGSEPASREGIAKRTLLRRLDPAAADAAARLHLLLAAGERVCDVAIINPIETAWAQMHPGWITSAETRALEDQIGDIASWLTGSNIDFDFLDEGLLARRASVLNGHLGLGPARYRAVIVAGSVTIRSTTLELLRQLTVTGGTVVFVGDTPAHIDGRPSSAAVAIAVDAARVPHARAELLRAVAPDSPPLVVESDSANVRCRLRRAGERWVAAFMNTSPDTRCDDVSALIDGSGALEEWDCETGATTPLDADSGAGLRWRFELEPLQLRIFVISPAASPGSAPAPAPSAAPITGGLDVVPLESAEWQVNRDPWQPPCDLLSLDQMLRADAELPQRGDVVVQPWARQESFGSTMRVKRLTLRFRFHLEALPKEQLDLLVESPAGWKFTINGTAIRTPARTEWHGDASVRRVPLPIDLLTVGPNEILALVPFIDETDLEPFGLLGRFTVVETEPMPKLRPR